MEGEEGKAAEALTKPKRQNLPSPHEADESEEINVLRKWGKTIPAKGQICRRGILEK